MHRFGRTANQKMKDRWGGGFILATVLALVAAYYLGDWLSTRMAGGEKTTGSNLPGMTTGNKSTGTNNKISAATPQEFSLHFVQVGVFRSPTGAKAQLAKIAGEKYAGLITPKDAKGEMRVLAGPFMDAASAADAKKALEDAGINAYVPAAMVMAHDPAAIPAVATGAKDTDLKTGLDTLNSYLQEVAMWMGDRTKGTGAVAGQGKALSDLALTLKDSKDAKVQEFAKLAGKAGENAVAIEALASSEPGTTDFQAAMSDYYQLLEGYRSFYTK